MLFNFLKKLEKATPRMWWMGFLNWDQPGICKCALLFQISLADLDGSHMEHFLHRVARRQTLPPWNNPYEPEEVILTALTVYYSKAIL